MSDQNDTKKPLTLEDLASAIEDLAKMVQEGFANTSTKQEVEALRQQLYALTERVELVENKLDRALFQEIDRLEKRIKKLEEKVGV